MSSIPDHANIIEVVDDDCEIIYLGERRDQKPILANPSLRRTPHAAATRPFDQRVPLAPVRLGCARIGTAGPAVRRAAHEAAQRQQGQSQVKGALPLPRLPMMTPALRKKVKNTLAERVRRDKGKRKSTWNVSGKRDTEEGADAAPTEKEAQGNHHHLPGGDHSLGRELAPGGTIKGRPDPQGDLGVPSLDHLPPLPPIPDPALAAQVFRHDSLYGTMDCKSRTAQLRLPRHDRSGDSLEYDGDGAIRMICIVWMRDRCHMLDAHTKTRITGQMQRNTTFAAISRHYGLPARLEAPKNTLGSLQKSIKVQADLLESYAAAYMFSHADPFDGLKALSTWFNGIFAAIFPFYHDQLLEHHDECVPAHTPGPCTAGSSASGHCRPDPLPIPPCVPLAECVRPSCRLSPSDGQLHRDPHRPPIR